VVKQTRLPITDLTNKDGVDFANLAPKLAVTATSFERSQNNPIYTSSNPENLVKIGLVDSEFTRLHK